MARAQMPSTVKVGCHVYSVIRKPAAAMPRDEDGNPLMGQHDSLNMRIFVRKYLKRSVAQETLWHEVKHACCYPDLNGATATEERFVNTMAPMELQVLQDNPELVEFLTQQ